MTKTGNMQALQSEIAELRHKLKLAEEKAAKLPQFDAVTKLPNKALFFDRLTQAIARTRRNKKLTAVAYIAVGYSKLLTAKHGEDAQHELLKEFSARFKTALREVDTLARLDDHHFAIIIEDVKRIAEVEKIMLKLLAHSDRGFSVKEEDVAVAVTVGVALYDNATHADEDLVGRAKSALSAAKKEKRALLMTTEAR